MGNGVYGSKQDKGVTTRLYDENSGGDPIQKGRIESSNVRERTGSTGYQRDGQDPDYRNGYGKSAPNNNRNSLLPKAQWDDQFKTEHQLAAEGAQKAGNAAGVGSAVMQNVLGIPTAIPGTQSHVDPYIQATPASGFHTPADMAIAADQSDWRGKGNAGIVPPMNNLFPGQAATASLAPHVQVQSNYRSAINPAATGNESAGQYADIAARNSAAYAPGGMSGRVDPYYTPSANTVAGIAQRYGTPGGQNGVAFVNDQRSNVDAQGRPLAPVAKTPAVAPGITPAVDANKKTIDPYV